MALRVVSMAELRHDVVTEPSRLGCTVSETCERWGISRQTYYRWKKRLERWGPEGLEDLSRRPFSSKEQIEPELEETICRMRKDHPRWGARTIRNYLRREGISPPAISTIHQALRRNHLVADQPHKRPKTRLRFEREVPNDLWQTDATRFVLTTGQVVWAFNFLDDHARYLLSSVACFSPTTQAAWKAFTLAASRYGLPRQVFSDNHLSFTGRLHDQVVEFERRLRDAGPRLINGTPGNAQGRGKIERLHRTMKEWVFDEGPPSTIAELQRSLDRFREHYNDERPHQGLPDDCTPAERYFPTEPAVLDDPPPEEPAYPAGAVVRTATKTGAITYRTKVIGVGVRWAGHRLRVVDVAEQTQVWYGGRLVRSLTIDPGRRYQPMPDPKLIGRRPRLVQE